TYERPQQPKSSSQSGTVYSYGYRDPNNSGVGKTETVYDADYRVIIPPAAQKPSSPENDWESSKDDEDDDWKF
ncbi:MAG: LapA family protein, partial [Tolypothrix sp. Co-bin9]|nr:LapA family protein [Tolypothrix sp. Co-bin9]